MIGDRYRVVAEIGEGAMGVVYRVEHTQLKKQMALKLLRPELSRDPTIKRRFELEARSVSTLDSPHIVRVTDFGFGPDSMFMVMELLEGRLLSEIIADGPTPVPRALALADQILVGLRDAHEAGVIHRDMKPDNIMVVDGPDGPDVKLLDFGLAKLSNPDPNRPITMAGMVFGTPKYMSPEQVSAHAIDHRTDLYAFSVLLFELLSGESPIPGEGPVEIMNNQVLEPARALELEPVRGYDVAAIAGAVAKGLSKDADERFPDAEAYRAALKDTERPSARPGLPKMGAPLWGAIGVALLMLMIALVAFVPVGPGRTLGEANEALALGEIESARALVDRALLEYPDDAGVHLMLGHVAHAQGKPLDCVSAYKKALELNGSSVEDPLFQINAHLLLRTRREAAGGLLEAAIREGGVKSASFLETVATESTRSWARRTAYEGLENIGATDRLEPSAYLRRELSKTRPKDCQTRRWYLERLIKLDDKHALKALKRELRRAKKRRRRCMRSEIEARVRELER